MLSTEIVIEFSIFFIFDLRTLLYQTRVVVVSCYVCLEINMFVYQTSVVGHSVFNIEASINVFTRNAI